ncbi:hypothetical protein CBS101457_002977 [Exobasidium rhododendri]|nr:hypothetical protein CBS101457_002977 [Exobasidium rhododendri]
MSQVETTNARATNVFITGASSGLGYEITKTLLQSSDTRYHIFLGSRSAGKAAEAMEALGEARHRSPSEVEAIVIDITDDKSIAHAVLAVAQKTDHLDVLVNNAGAQFDQQYAAGKMGMRDMWNANFDTNVTSSHMVTEAFMPLLIASSSPRLVFTSSGTASLEEASRGLPVQAGKPPAGWPKPPTFSFTAYRTSKTAVNMVMLEWKRILSNDAVKVFAVDPGFLATNLGGFTPAKLKGMGALDPSVGAAFVKDVIDGKRDSEHGKCLRRAGVAPW